MRAVRKMLSYLLFIATVGGIYGLLALSLNLMWGGAGLGNLRVAALAVVFVVMRRIDRSPYGRALRAIREDAQVAQVAGKRVLRFKTEAFALSAAIAGLAGALYGHFTSYIAPDLFLPLITVYIFLAVASGGTGRPAGALVGAYLVMTLLESSRFLVEWIPGVTAAPRCRPQ